jgi:hypothetical protein
VICPLPTYEPGAPVSFEPTIGLPEIGGADWLAGLLPARTTTDVAELVEKLVPPNVCAKTRTRMRLPLSALEIVYMSSPPEGVAAEPLEIERDPDLRDPHARVGLEHAADDGDARDRGIF